MDEALGERAPPEVLGGSGGETPDEEFGGRDVGGGDVSEEESPLLNTMEGSSLYEVEDLRSAVPASSPRVTVALSIVIETEVGTDVGT